MAPFHADCTEHPFASILASYPGILFFPLSLVRKLSFVCLLFSLDDNCSFLEWGGGGSPEEDGSELTSLLCCDGSSDEFPVPVHLSTVASCGRFRDMNFLISMLK